MARYQVALVARPEGWRHTAPDDVPPSPGTPLEVLAEEDGLFAAVKGAVEHNVRAEAEGGDRWAVVVEPGSFGRTWPGTRLCTPITYRVMSLWWPERWEPQTPLDVPNCVWQAQGGGEQPPMSYERAEATVQGLNRQCMDNPGVTWHVVAAVENESVSRTVSYDAAGTETTVEVRRMHVIRPERGGRGDCSHCPAHTFECAKAEWQSQAQTLTARESRSPAAR